MGSAPSIPDVDAASVPASAALATGDPLVSVIVPTHLGADRIGTCLDSLCRQSLAASRFEIVVVQNGPDCDTPKVVDDVRRRNPAHKIRLVVSRQSGAGRARNLGIDAARGSHLTFVDDDDWVSRDYLAVLLESARPGVVPTAYIAEVPEGLGPDDAVPDFDNYISRKLIPLSGRTLPVQKIATVLSLNAGKLLPTTLARAVKYDEELRSGEDFVFWIGAQARAGFQLHVTARERGAVYYRSVRAGSLSRRELDYDFHVRERLDCVAALQRIPHDRPFGERLVLWATTGQAEHIHGYVERHPDCVAQVRADALARGVEAAVPWRAVNRGLARDLAVLYCFTPYQDTSALVAARRLRERAVITDVISQAMDNIRTKDWSAHRIAHEFLDDFRILPGTAHFGGWEPTRVFALTAAKEARRMQAAKGPYRTLYTRAMAAQSHFAGALIKLQNPDIEWTAEFSDPLLMNAYGEERAGDVGDDLLVDELASGIRAAGFDLPDTAQLYSWAEQLPYVLADRLVFTNEHQRDFMLGYCRNRRAAERAAGIAEVSHHPTLPERFYRADEVGYPLADDRVHIGYFGVFYLTRGLTEVTAALESLSPAERDRVRLHVFTDRPDQLEMEVLKRGLSDVVNVRGYVPFLQFLNLTTRFDALLVNDAATAQHHSVNPYLPSKLSDYRGSGTPIWAIYEPDSVLSGQPVDFRSRLGDAEAAASVLRGLIARGRRTTPEARTGDSV